YVWTGTVDSWQPVYAPGQYSDTTTTVAGSDAFKQLQAYQPATPGVSEPSETVDVRIGAILDSAQWPAADRSLDVSATTLASAQLTNTGLADIQAATNSEQGRFYVGADGKTVFENRNHRSSQTRSNTVQAVWESQRHTGGAFQFESCV